MKTINIDAWHGGQPVGKIYHGGQMVDFVIHQGKLIFAAAAVPLPDTLYRIVADAGQKWFEVGFLSCELLGGNAAAGWTDAGNYCALHLEWSPDLVTWSVGKFLPAPTPVVDNGDGTWWYWSRAINPVDAAIKTGSLVCSSNTGDGDSRNNPFTAITIAGVVQSLPNYPYTMPTHAAQLQADLIAAGWTGATVAASSNVVWTVTIPTVNYTSYAQTSMINWPAYTVPDPIFGVDLTMESRSFRGTFVNQYGVPIFPRAFGRLGVTQGSRFQT